MHQEFCDPKQFLFKAHGPGLESTENTSSKNQTTPCKYKVKMNAFVTWGIRLRIDLVRQQTLEQPFGPDSSDPLGKVRTSFQHRNQMFNICFQSHPHSWMHFKWHAGIMNGMVGIGIHLRKLGTPIMGEIVMAMVGCASSSTSTWARRARARTPTHPNPMPLLRTLKRKGEKRREYKTKQNAARAAETSTKQ